MKHVIVSRHSATVEWLKKKFEVLADAPVLPAVTAEDVRGKVVVGNLPLHLAAEAEEVWAVGFKNPPRGSELHTVEDVERAGVFIEKFRVLRLESEPQNLITR